MEFSPDACWDCPLPLGSSLVLAVVAVFLLYLGRVLHHSRSRVLRGLGVIATTLGVIMYLIGLTAIWRFGIASRLGPWPERHRGTDLAFVVGWCACGVAAWYQTRWARGRLDRR